MANQCKFRMEFEFIFFVSWLLFRQFALLDLGTRMFFLIFLIVYSLSASIIVITSSSELQTSYKFSPIAAHQTTFFTKLEKSCKFNRAAQNFPSLQCLSLQTRTCQDHNHRDLKEQHVPRMEAFSETVHSIPICKNWSSQL